MTVFKEGSRLDDPSTRVARTTHHGRRSDHGRDDKFQLGSAVGACFNVLHLDLAHLPSYLDAVATSGLRHIITRVFDRFAGVASMVGITWVVTWNSKAFAPAYVFDFRIAQVKFTRALTAKRSGGVGVFHPQGNVEWQLPLERMYAQLTAGHEICLLYPGKTVNSLMTKVICRVDFVTRINGRPRWSGQATGFGAS